MFRAVTHYYRPALAAATWRDAGYLAAGLVFGTVWFSVIVSLYAAGVSTAVVWVGVPVLIFTQSLLRPIGRFERFLARTMLGAEIREPRPLSVNPPPHARHPRMAALWERGHELVHDGHSWRVLAWITVRAVAGPLGFALVLVTLVVQALALLVPVAAVVGTVVIDGQDEAWLWPWLLLGVGAFLLLAPGLAWGIRGLAALHRMLAEWALGPCQDEVEEAAIARATFAEEQVRIDQELHDSIGHMISMIVVQAGAGAHVFDRDPAFARGALSNIEERGRAALGELDRIIARIRGDHVETHAPLPGAQDLPALVAGARDAGMDVDAHLDVGDVPPALGRGVYRVVQEALTNAAKHAPGGAVQVEVAQGEEAVAVSVVNDLMGARARPGGRGNGLASIRDRVTLMGGQATIGETKDGGFAVRAVLPLAAMLPESATLVCRLAASCRCLGCSIRRKVLA